MELYRISYHQKWSKPKSVMDPVVKNKPNTYHSKFVSQFDYIADDIGYA